MYKKHKNFITIDCRIIMSLKANYFFYAQKRLFLKKHLKKKMIIGISKELL